MFYFVETLIRIRFSSNNLPHLRANLTEASHFKKFINRFENENHWSFEPYQFNFRSWRSNFKECGYFAMNQFSCSWTNFMTNVIYKEKQEKRFFRAAILNFSISTVMKWFDKLQQRWSGNWHQQDIVNVSQHRFLIGQIILKIGLLC